MGEWQPIETAPKDGRAVLVWNRYQVEIAAYLTNPKSRTGSWHVKTTTGWNPAYFNIKYWMPLPEAPE